MTQKDSAEKAVTVGSDSEEPFSYASYCVSFQCG